MIENIDAEFHKWKGVADRNRKLCEKNDFLIAGMPEKHWDKLKKECKWITDHELDLIEQSIKPQAINSLGDKIGFAFDKKELAKHILQSAPCYYDKARNWWIWDAKEFRWERVDETDILNAIDEQAIINTVNSKEKTEILEALRQVSRKNKPKEIKKTWIQFKDVIVDILTGEKINATSEYFVTNPIPHKPNDEGFEETPVMDRIFEEWVGKDYVRTLYEIIAYSLIPDYPIHRLFCFMGTGLNGKSKYLELLRRFIGSSNCCSTELDVLLKSRFEITRLHKKLICQMGETDFDEMSKTSILKKLTGGDLIGFEYKNKDTFDDINYAKIIIATNNLPTTTDKTIGFYRRWLIVDFPNQFSEKKDILAEIPDEEYGCLANKCIIILKDILETREFTNEGSIEERRDRYEARSNFLEKFLELFTESDIDGYITSADFYKKFISWSKEQRHRTMSETSVGLGMKELGIEKSKKYFNWLYDGKGGQLRCWVGIQWKD